MLNSSNNSTMEKDFDLSQALEIIKFEPLEPNLPAIIPNIYEDVKFEDTSHGCFEMRNEGLFARVRGKYEYISQPFRVLTSVMDLNGSSSGILIEFCNKFGENVKYQYKKSDLIKNNSNIVADLVDLDFKVCIIYIKEFKHALSSISCEINSTITFTNGWINETSDYFLNGRLLTGDTNQNIIWGGDKNEGYLLSGCIDEWNNVVGEACKHSNIIALSVCASLAAPALRICNLDGFGFHFWGGSSNGKSLAVEAGSSIYGKPIKSWNTTANGLEGAACSSNDGIICLDELGEGEAKDVSKIAYMLANGRGKQRANINGDARDIKTWKLILLSSGEITLANKISEDYGNSKIKAGQLVRIIEIPLDENNPMGVFETIPDRFKTSDLYADHLKENIPLQQGTIIKELVAQISINQDEFLTEFYDYYLKSLKERFKESSNQVKRALKNFALCMAAGEFAVSKGILKFDKNYLAKAILRNLEVWMKSVPNANYEVLEGVRAIKKLLEEQGRCSFISVSEDELESRPKNASKDLGVMGNYNGGKGNIFCIYKSTFEDLVMKGINPKPALAYLEKTGILITNAGRKDYKVYSPLAGDQIRTFAISNKIFDLDLNEI